jgi:hypothetical protein
MNETPAEQRLLDHLGGLREHPPEADEQLVHAVMSSVRWQASVRPYLSAVGVFAAAFAGYATGLMGTTERK